MPLLVSPDGAKFAAGPDIRDVATGEIVTSFPGPDASAGAWFDEGIVYSTTEVKVSETKIWIWQPGSVPAEISGEISGCLRQRSRLQQRRELFVDRPGGRARGNVHAVL